MGKEIEGEFRDACFSEEKINGLLKWSAKYNLEKQNIYILVKRKWPIKIT